MGNRVLFLYDFRYYLYKLLPILLFAFILFQSKNYRFYSLLKVLFSLVLGVLTYFISDCSDLFLTFLFIIAAKNIDFNDFIKKDLNIKSLLLLFVVCCSFLGFTNEMISYRDGIPRYPLGFGHPNALGAILLSLCIDIIILYSSKIKIKHVLFFIVCLYITIFVCDSRSAQMGIFLLLFLLFVFRLKKDLKHTSIFYILPLFCFIISIFFINLYLDNNSFAFVIDEFTSGRVRYAAEFYEYYDITLFGNYFEFFGKIKDTSYLSMLDNAYINLLLRFGIVSIVLFLTFFTRFFNTCIKKNLIGCFIALFVILIYGLMESYIWLLVYNPILLYLSNYLYYKE